MKTLEVVVVVIRLILILGVLNSFYVLQAQNHSLKYDTTEVEIDFLSSYYNQDGDNSAVTGGLGTEKLSTIDNRIVVSFAPDSVQKVTTKLGVNSITSASTDNIDGVTSASKHDAHTSISISYSKINIEKRVISSFNASASTESDYSSKGIGYSLEKVNKNSNHKMGVSVNAFFDDWVMIFPEELREDKENFPTKDFRNSYSLTLFGKHVVNKRTLFHWNVGNTFQNGLLSTPFHRVYFNDTTISGLEVLPYHRFKLPISLGINFFAFHNLILKPKYRLYFDTFGIISNTISLKAILKLNPYFSLHGTYRYAYQKGSNYFREHAEHSSSDVYKTSDYDLSTFSSFYYNLGIRYSPLSPILSIKRFSLNKVEIRYANFRRSNDLKSNLISGALSFSLKRK